MGPIYSFGDDAMVWISDYLHCPDWLFDRLATAYLALPAERWLWVWVGAVTAAGLCWAWWWVRRVKNSGGAML